MQAGAISHRKEEIITWQAAAMLHRCGVRVEVQLRPPMNWIPITNPRYMFNLSTDTRRYRIAEE